jgi:tetratricopeptide (TPR) repeat protein
MEYGEKGEFDSAIKEFETAYKLDQSPIFLYNTARCYVKKGEYEKALVYYKLYVSQPIPQDKKEKALQHMKEIEDAINARSKPAVVDVLSGVPDTLIFIDEERTGFAPLSGMKLLPGKHSFKAVRSGYVDQVKVAEFKPGENSTVSFSLEKIPEIVRVKTIETETDENPFLPWAWAGTISGILLAGAGTGMLIWAYSLANDADSLNIDDPLYDEKFDSKISDAHQKLTLSYILYGAGGAAMITGLVLFLMEPDSSSSVQTNKFHIYPAFSRKNSFLTFSIYF